MGNSSRHAASLALLAAVASLAACQRASDEPAGALAPAPEADAPTEGVLRAYVWKCDGGLTLHMKNLPRENAITLEMHEGPRKLTQTPAASGVRYADATLTFWTKGETATFERKGSPAINCRVAGAQSLLADARERGVVYRGQGNEPGWTVEIGPGQSLTYVTSYGQERHEFKDITSGVGTEAGIVVLQGRHNDVSITVKVAKEPCKDDMSGADFDHRFVVEFGGKTHRGCGSAL